MLIWPTKIKIPQKKCYKWVYTGYPGEIEKVLCNKHTYSWSGNVPCTGIRRCVHCGKYECEC